MGVEHPSAWANCDPSAKRKGCECATCAPERYPMLPGLDAPELPLVDLKKRRSAHGR